MTSYEDAWKREDDQTHRPGLNSTFFFYRAHRQGLLLLHCQDTLAALRPSRRDSVVHEEEREVNYLSMNAVIRTDGPVVLTKPPRGTRKGEFNLISSDEQTRIFNAA